MARGWESKSVEAQQEERGARKAAGHILQELSPFERERRAKVESLKLSRARTLEQLERAASPAHRAMLKRTLVALERELSQVEASEDGSAA